MLANTTCDPLVLDVMYRLDFYQKADEHVAVENWLWVLLGKVDLVFYLFLFSLPAETFTSEQLKVEQKMKYEEILSVFSLTW